MFTTYPHPLFRGTSVLTKEASSLKRLVQPSLEAMVKSAAQVDVPDHLLEVPTEVTRGTMWTHEDSSPLALILFLIDTYGTALLEWEAETLYLTVERDFEKPSDAVWTKLLAARAIVHSPSPWNQWEVFHWSSVGLVGEPPNFHFIEKPSLGRILNCVDVMNTLDPDRETQEEVDKYIAATLKSEGIVYAPDIIHFVRDDLEERKLRCGNCESITEDDGDVRCISCGSDELVPIPYEHAAFRDHIHELFEQRRMLPLREAVVGLEGTPAKESTYRLLIHWDELMEERRESILQLRMLL